MPETLDSHESQPHRSWRVSEWPVVRKVGLVLAIPLLLAVALGGLRVQGELDKATAASATASQVTVLAPAVAYLAAAEDAAMVFRASDDEAERNAALKAVNDAASRLETAWSSADLSEAQRQQVRTLLDQTQGLRDGSAYAIVSTSVDQLETLEAEVTLNIAAMTDAGSAGESLIGLVGQLNQGRLAVTQTQLLVNPRPDVIPKNELFGLLGAESAAIANLEQLLPDDESVALLSEYNASNFGLLGIGTPELKGQAPLKLYDEVSTDLLGQIQTSLNAQAAGANRTALITALLVALALGLAIFAALKVSRILVKPIREVRDGALAVAHQQLPETVRRIRAGEDPGELAQIPVTTHEEMGQLARAVDDLHGTAVRLARGEAELRSRVADMFVTLSRRNTSLVNQQLRLIEKLESDEEDPQRLASLFKLDHLASRMRRTAESLVVLADAPTQSSEQDALSVDEALQAAIAGVQDYQRVAVSGAPSLRISGVAAPDVVHLFTELVDNALAFSPPHSPVTVTATTPAGMVLVEIDDAGLGIDTATLAELNQTLRGGSEISSETARRMGLFVVARLARRHGLTVALERNVEGGTTAKVFIPKPLLTSTDAPLSLVDAPEPEAEAPAPVAEPVVAPVRPMLTDSLFKRPAPAPLEPVAEVEAPVDEPALEEAVEEPVAEVEAPVAEPAPEPEKPAPAATPGLDALSAVINANIRLPQRRPGTSDQPTALTPVLPQRGRPVPEPEPAAEVEVEVEPVAEPEVVEPELTPEPVAEVAIEEPEVEVPDTLDEEEAEVLASVSALPEPAVVEPVVAGPVVVEEPEQVEQPEPVQDALGAVPTYALDEHEDDAETPLFRSLRSSWFSNDGDDDWGSNEADAGWRAVDRVAEVAPSRLTQSGLPVRDPGNRLVPGGVTQVAPSMRRDPEAIRARLAAHAAGVARGRSMAAPALDTLTEVQPTETPEDVTP